MVLMVNDTWFTCPDWHMARTYEVPGEAGPGGQAVKAHALRVEFWAKGGGPAVAIIRTSQVRTVGASVGEQLARIYGAEV